MRTDEDSGGRMRAMRIVAATVVATLLLSGCSLLPQFLIPLVPLIPHGQPAPTTGPDVSEDPAEPADGPLAIGSCLDGMNGADSDREALVGCGGPHLFDVVGIVEWPGMTAQLAATEPGDVYDTLYSDTDEGAEYYDWASRTCMAAVQQTLGIDAVTIDGLTAADLWLRLGGSYGVDLSLASRDAFIAGDHTTVCSAAWYHSPSRPSRIEYPAGLGFADLLDPRFGPEWRECRTIDYFDADCGQDHWGQVVAAFEGLAAFGPEFVGKVADGTARDADWVAADDLCHQVMVATLPPSANAEGLNFAADVAQGYGWDSYQGSVDQPGGYFFACVVASGDPDRELTGDVIAGTASVVGSST